MVKQKHTIKNLSSREGTLLSFRSLVSGRIDQVGLTKEAQYQYSRQPLKRKAHLKGYSMAG